MTDLAKIKLFLFDKTVILIILSLLLALFLRMHNLIGSGGLWLDECLSYYNASFPFGAPLINNLAHNSIHSPLYFLLLNLWMKLFNNSDITLKLFSVLFGVINIPVAYLAGKEMLDRQTGLLSAMLFSVNAFLIYYSQEVRFYSLLALLSTLVFYFLFKIKNNPTKYAFAGLILSNLAILFTFTISLPFVIIQSIIFGIYFFRHNRENFKKLLYSYLLIFTFYLPYFPVVIYQLFLVHNNIINFVGDFHLYQILSIIQNYFSPVLINTSNNSLNYSIYFLSGIKNINYIFYAVIPVAISLYAIKNTILKRNFASLILLIGFLYIIIIIIAAYTGKLNLITRYTMLSLPTFILAVAYGLKQIKIRTLGIILTTYLITVGFSYNIFGYSDLQKASRLEGLKYVSVALTELKFGKDDIVIMPYGARFFNKYYQYNDAIIKDFDILRLGNPDKSVFFDNNVINSIKSGKDENTIINYAASIQPSKNLSDFMHDKILSRVKKRNQRVAIVLSPMLYNIYSMDELRLIAESGSKYYDIPMFNLLISKIVHDTINLTSAELRLDKMEKYRGWIILVYKKI